jgi:bifunctional non-homologous end joining protein LigD
MHRGKGLHVSVSRAGNDQWPVVKCFAARLAEEMVAAPPEADDAAMSKAKRTGGIFIDYFRKDYTATALADYYAVRARPGATVAVCLEWNELKNLTSARQFTIKDILNRLKNKKPEPATGHKGQTIPST